MNAFQINRWRLVLPTLLVCCFSLPAFSQTAESILPANPYSDGAYIVPATRTLLRTIGWQAEPIAVNGQPFTQGFRITVNGTSAKLSNAGLSWATTRAVRANDNLTLTFWVRKLAPLDNSNIRGLVTFGATGGALTAEVTEASLATPFPCDGEVWMRYTIPFRAQRDYAAGEGRLAFQFGQGPQVFGLGGLALTNAGATPPLTAQGATAIREDSTSNPSAYFDSSVGGGSARVVDVAGQPFTRAIELTVNGQSQFIYNAGLQYRNTIAFQQGDVMMLSFWARRLESANASLRAQVVFENRTSFNKSLSVTFGATNDEWQFYQLPFVAAEAAAVDAFQLSFQFGLGPQKFQLAGIALVHFGTRATLAQLPMRYPYAYRGDLNAAWRQAANARINEHRKAELTVNVSNPLGHAVTGATVYVQQLDHAFKFGSAVVAQRINTASFDHDQYRSRISSHFNTSVLENDLKWPSWECTTCSNFSKDGTVRALQWLRERDIAVRGHNLIWPSWQYSPNGLQNLTPDALRKRIDDHFADVLTFPGVNGQAYQWDVINEAFTNNNVMGLIGGVAGVTQRDGVLPNSEMVRWFQQARQHDAQAKLFYNDYDILAANGWNRQKQDYVYTLVNWLLDNGAPVDGVGMQGHFAAVTQIDTMQEIIARFSQLRVPFNITEFDFNTPDEALQADFTRDVVTLLFSSPRCTDFLMWGFWERAHWLPQGAMYRADWSSKPNALVWNELLFNEWWTNESGATNREGQFTVRAFKGKQRVTVCTANECKEAIAQVENNSAINVVVSDGKRAVRPLAQ